MRNSLRSTVLLLSAGLTAQAGQALVAPIVVTYSPDGLQLTPVLVNGLLAGCVGRRANAAGREANPDWPPLVLHVAQDSPDERQPPGYFSAQLVVEGARNERAGDGELLRAVVSALEQELNARMHDAPRAAVEARLTPAKTDLATAERELAELREALVHLQRNEGGADVDDLRATLQELELQLRADEPLVDIGTKQTVDFEERLRRLVHERATLEAKAAEIEGKLETEGHGTRSDLRRNLIDIVAAREEKARLIDALGSQISNTSSALQERTNRLLEMRVRMEGLRAQVEQGAKAREAAHQRALECAAHEARIADLQRRVDWLRQRTAELTQEAERLVPVRVTLWR